MRRRWAFSIGIALLIGIGCAILSAKIWKRYAAATVEPFQGVTQAPTDIGENPYEKERKIKTIMTGRGAEEIFKIEIPRSFAVWMLEQSPNIDPLVIRKDILANWNQRFTEYTTSTATQITEDTKWSTDPKTNTCKVLEDLSTRYYKILEELRPRVQDLSGTVYNFVKEKDKNFGYQNDPNVLEKCLFSQSPACRELASQDKLIVDALPKYESTNTTLFEKEIEIKEAILLLNSIAQIIECNAILDRSTLDTATNSVTDPKNLRDRLGYMDTPLLRLKLKELSPYYIPPAVSEYISRVLIDENTIDAEIKTLKTLASDIQGSSTRLKASTGV